MPKKYRKIFQNVLIVVILAAFALPFLSLAAGLQLETIYPAAPSTQQVITGHTKLPEIIRYAVSWTIIIAALVTAFSLIYAGVQYLTSVGRPNAMTAAKSRIWKCFLGLLIIASSYLILQLINPQLTIMTIKRQQVGAGIIMFTQAGLYGTDKVNDIPTANKCYAPIITGGTDNSTCMANTIADCYNPNMVNGFNTTNSDTLENLIKAGEARFLSYDMPNLTAEFGNMAKEPYNTSVNFTKFPLYAIGFWGDEATQGGALIKDTKIFVYPNTQYNLATAPATGTKNKAVEYRIGGKVDSEGGFDTGKGGRSSCKAVTAGSGANDFGIQLITIHDDFATNFNSKVPYYDKTFLELDLNSPPQPTTVLKPHPPLSIKVQSEGLGVILYSSASGGSRSFAASAEDFGLSNVKFDNLADEIKVDNTASMAKLIKECKTQFSDPTDQNNCVSKSLRRDFLAILHSGYYFAGDLRLFFEKRGKSNTQSTIFPDDPPVRFPMIYEDESFTGGGITDLTDLEKKTKYYRQGQYCGVDFNCSNTGQGLGEPGSADNSLFYYPTDALTNVGNQGTPTPAAGYTKFAINEIDQFGRLKANDKASSLELFEIEKKQGAFWVVGSDDDNNNEGAVASKNQSIVCREVKLCTGKGLLNDCLVFVPDTPDDIQKKYKDYNSIVLPMPLYIPVNIPVALTALVKTYDDSGATVIKKKEGIEFNDKIKSLSIDGDCVVVLFENGIKDITACKTCSNNGTADASCKKCWDGGGPGANSEVFTESVNDLTTHTISKCGGSEKFGFGDRKNCASAIAIFPIKKTEE